MKNKPSFNGLHLKLIGWAFTLCSVLAAACFPPEETGILKLILTYLGYISLPIFAFLIVEGFAYTENKEKYVASVFIAALLTEPFYDYACSGVWFSLVGWNGQNILFALGFGLIQLLFLRYMGTGSGSRKFLTVSMVIACACWMFILNVPGGIVLQLLVGVFYLLHEKPRTRNLMALVLAASFTTTGALAIPLIYFYNDERGDYNKYIFYLAYPAVWAVFAAVRLLGA